MSARYDVDLDLIRGIVMAVRFSTRGRDVTDYAVVLVAQRGVRKQTIRVYDCAHGHNEMHRYSAARGKHSGITFHSGTLGEGMRLAIEEIRSGYRKMIEA